MAKGPTKKASKDRRELAKNRKARYDFEVLEVFDAGIVLEGTEVKSLRQQAASLEDSYVRIENGEAFWVKGHIPEYSHGNQQNHDPDRKRKLLLRKGELKKLESRVKVRGLTLVPLALFLSSRNLIKLSIGLCRGKKRHDKRESERERAARREIREE